jgi:hypothetical protein
LDAACADPMSDCCGVLRCRRLLERISVAMYELPLAVFTAIDLGHPQIERHGLILAAHIRLGALETDPVTNVAVGRRVEGLERVLAATGKQRRVPFISRPNLFGARGHIASRTEEGRRKLLSNDTSQRFGIATYVVPARGLALEEELLEIL